MRELCGRELCGKAAGAVRKLCGTCAKKLRELCEKAAGGCAEKLRELLCGKEQTPRRVSSISIFPTMMIRAYGGEGCNAKILLKTAMYILACGSAAPLHRGSLTITSLDSTAGIFRRMCRVEIKRFLPFAGCHFALRTAMLGRGAAAPMGTTAHLARSPPPRKTKCEVKAVRFSCVSSSELKRSLVHCTGPPQDPALSLAL